jgi:hypothetical protein
VQFIDFIDFIDWWSLMSDLKTAFAAIHRVNCEPELKFAAALIADAAESARGGDCESYAWIERCSLRWLYAITPAWDDCERVHRALLATIPAPAECVSTFEIPMQGGIPRGSRAPSRSPPSETAAFIQPLLPGLEVHHGHGDCLQEVRPRAPTELLRDQEREAQAVPGM